MKRNYLTLTIGIVLILVFALLLFAFQVRQTEVALVTTFGKPTKPYTEPGLYWKWPWPIQKVQSFDKRIQSFEDKFEQVYTKDGRNLLVMVYVGWSIVDPSTFSERFGGSVQRAQSDLEGLIRSSKQAVVGQHPFGHFISTEEKELKFTDIEQEILKSVSGQARSNYGIEVKFLGIKKLGLPESITAKVFERMKEERQREVKTLLAQGESRASDIRSEANRSRTETLARAEAKSMEIRGRAEAEAEKYYAVLEQQPELATLLLKLSALELSLKERSSLVLDARTPPFDLLVPEQGALRNPVITGKK